MTKIIQKCQNCGHDCHCGGHCMKNYDGNSEILCCSHCRHKKDDGFDPDEVKYDSMDYESFNGA